MNKIRYYRTRYATRRSTVALFTLTLSLALGACGKSNDCDAVADHTLKLIEGKSIAMSKDQLLKICKEEMSEEVRSCIVQAETDVELMKCKK